MKQVLMRIGIFASPRRRWALPWCLVAAALLLAAPGVGRAQASGAAEATEQLFDAVYANDFAAVQASVAAGADVEASDRWGMSPMELAIDKGYFEIGHYLVAVRNFSRAKADDRPAARAASGSPFASRSSDELAARPEGPVSPLGPMSKPANDGDSGPSPSGTVDLETSAGGPTGSADTANPFDPNGPALGSAAFSVGEIKGPETGFSNQTRETSPDTTPDGAKGSGFSNRVVGVGGQGQ